MSLRECFKNLCCNFTRRILHLTLCCKHGVVKQVLCDNYNSIIIDSFVYTIHVFLRQG